MPFPLLALLLPRPLALGTSPFGLRTKAPGTSRLVLEESERQRDISQAEETLVKLQGILDALAARGKADGDQFREVEAMRQKLAAAIESARKASQERMQEAQLLNGTSTSPDALPIDGPAVEALQKALVQLGYDLPVTGRLELETVWALKAFQWKQGLPLTGMVDAATRQAMDDMIKNEAPST